MKRVAVVQARMASSRLPGKILADLAGRPLLAQVLRRVRAMREVDAVVVATTSGAADDPVAALARAEGVGCFRGDEADVLSRYVGAAREAAADVVIRVTADCPLLDPAESDRVVRRLLEDPGLDYASNVVRRTFPRGLDTEALGRGTLERTADLARSAPAREHVTWFIVRERPELFRCASVEGGSDESDLRWTVDTPEDLEMVRRIYAELDLGHAIRPWREVLAHVRAHPGIAAMNSGVRQKQV